MKQTKIINDEAFALLYELDDIVDVKEDGYSNMYDITVSGNHTFLLSDGTVSHNSATGGFLPVFGREDIGYFELKGKPANLWDKKANLQGNKELAELYSIIKTEGYEYLCMGTDQDLDGFHIRGLLIGFHHKYTINDIELCVLETPVIGIKKGKNLIDWSYDIEAELKIPKGCVSKYYKGIGSWKETDLEIVVKKDGLETMIRTINFDDISYIDNWLTKTKIKSDIRKEYLKENYFNISSM